MYKEQPALYKNMEKMNQKPLVSIIMPVYNGAFFLVEAIESIMSQTFQDFEFIMVNDGSTDKTGKIIEYYKNLYPDKIRYFNIDNRGGAFAAINLVVKETRGEFIALMDSDDISMPERLEKQVAFLRDNLEIIILGTQANIIDKNGELIGKKRLPITNREIKKEFAFSHPMVHPSCLIRKSLLPYQTHIYENKFGVNDDYYTFFKLLNYGQFANLPEILYNYRIHNDNSSLKNLKKTLINTIKIRILAWRRCGYQLPALLFILMPLQFIIFSIIPNKFVLTLYFLFRGIYSISDLYSIFLQKIRNFFLRPVYLLLYKQ